jgi:hypothetical protein
MELGLGRVAQGGHRLVQRGRAADLGDGRKKLTPGRRLYTRNHEAHPR